MITIAEVMSKDVKKTTVGTSIAEAAERMRDNRVGSLLVEKDRQLVGIVTDTDVVRKAVAERKDLAQTTVASIMTHLHNIDSTQLLLDAHDMMRYSGVRHLAVREDGNVVGILSVGDLAAYFAWRSEGEVPPPWEPRY